MNKLAAVPSWADAWRGKGYTIEVLSPEEVRTREPLLSSDMAGAVAIADEGQVVPARLTKAYAQAARNLGATLYEHAEVMDVQSDETGRRVEGVWTRQGDFVACNHLVVAAGAWSSQFAVRLGITLPIRPVRGELVAVRPPSPTVIRHIIFDEGLADVDFYAAPKPDGTLLLGATKVEAGYDTTVSAGGVLHLLRVGTQLILGLASWPIERMWAGLRPKSSDSKPLLGPVPGWQNVTLATGHAGFGISLSAITGETIARSIITRRISDSIASFVPQKEQAPRNL